MAKQVDVVSLFCVQVSLAVAFIGSHVPGAKALQQPSYGVRGFNFDEWVAENEQPAQKLSQADVHDQDLQQPSYGVRGFNWAVENEQLAQKLSDAGAHNNDDDVANKQLDQELVARPPVRSESATLDDNVDVANRQLAQDLIGRIQSNVRGFNWNIENKPRDQLGPSFMVRPGFDEASPRWLDENGQRIEAHGAGLLQSPHDKRWYWYGESKKGELENPGVNCYSAKALSGPWRWEGRVFGADQIKIEGWEMPFVVERPKVIFNKRTQKYVMWVHVDHRHDDDFGIKLRQKGQESISDAQCDEYFERVGCDWTTSWNCPFQKPGTRGMASADPTAPGFHCCCSMNLWRKSSRQECDAYMSRASCDWTSERSCPSQPLGRFGSASDDRSTAYQCCCDRGLWRSKSNSTATLLSVKKAVVQKTDAAKTSVTKSTVEKINVAKTSVAKTSVNAKSKLTARQRQKKTRQKMRARSRLLRAGLYILKRVGVATSDTPNGPFTLEHVIEPDGHASLDLSLWVDNDGTAYFIRSVDNAYTAISRLTADYLDSEGVVSKGPLFEGMAMFRHTNGTLYMMTSHLSGWNPNPLMLYRSDGPDLNDPQWVDLGNPTDDPVSFNTQPTYVVPYTTQSGMTYHIYMADNWVNAGRQGLTDASYVWLPIRFLSEEEGGGVQMDRLKEWDLENPFDIKNTNLWRAEYAAEKAQTA